MIAPNAGLSVNRQCTLLGIARSSFYYQPRPPSAEEFDLLNRLDRIFTEHPVYGSRRLQVALLREGISVGRRRIRRLMRKLGLCAIRPKRNTSKPHPDHKIYPYLLRDMAIDSVEPGLGDRHQCAAASGVRDGGRPPAIGLQEQVANHRKRRGSKARVVSVTEKAPARRQVGDRKANNRELPFKCRKCSDDVETGE